ncbi:uncharacterized protein LOC135833909 [Planococcus citri]|uniref:uncharacterized protein LOC135833909 n=1 Tax=Planococcus citri TaxID=170843 RepID=UPI0031F78628
MSRNFAMVVPWMMCIVMSQVLFMAAKPSPEGQPPEQPAPKTVPNEPNNAPTTKQQQISSGIMNGIARAINQCCHSMYDSLLGETGYLIKLHHKIFSSGGISSKKKEKEEDYVEACCIDGIEDPLRDVSALGEKIGKKKGKKGKKGDDDVDETRVNGCWIGEKLFNVDNGFKWILKPQFNCGIINVKKIFKWLKSPHFDKDRFLKWIKKPRFFTLNASVLTIN